MIWPVEHGFSLDAAETIKFHQIMRAKPNKLAIHYSVFCPVHDFDPEEVIPNGFCEELSKENLEKAKNRDLAIKIYTRFLNNIRPSWNDTGFLKGKKVNALTYDIKLGPDNNVESFDIRHTEAVLDRSIRFGQARHMIDKPVIRKKDKNVRRDLQFIHDFALHQYNTKYNQNLKSLRFSTVNGVLTEFIQENMFQLSQENKIGCLGRQKNEKKYFSTLEENNLLPVKSSVIPGTASREGKHCINIMSADFYSIHKKNMFPNTVLTAAANYYQLVA